MGPWEVFAVLLHIFAATSGQPAKQGCGPGSAACTMRCVPLQGRVLVCVGLGALGQCFRAPHCRQTLRGNRHSTVEQ